MNFSKKTGNKKAAAAAVICFVAAIAIAGTYTFNDYRKSQSEKDLAMAEEMELMEEYPDETVDGEIVSNEPAEQMENAASVEEQGDNPDTNDDAKAEAEEQDDGNVKTAPTSSEEIENVSAFHAANVNFTENSLMLWPVSGAVLMDYSMDKTVYFKTLNQYKYNPAMIIAGAQGDQVIAGVSGIVKSIDETAQTGMTVNVDFGNGYEALYGQLESLEVKTGDYVDATTTLGYVAEPTKYYSSEGSNLYFEMRKDGQPVDPKMYLTEYAE